MKKTSTLLSGLALASVLALPLAASAQVVTSTNPTTPPGPAFKHAGRGGHMPFSLFGRKEHDGKFFSGQVTAVNGSTITISKQRRTMPISYSIDATSATVTTGMGTGTASNVSAIHVGDHITVVGTLNGSTISATSIRDMGQIKPEDCSMRKGGHMRNMGNH